MQDVIIRLNRANNANRSAPTILMYVYASSVVIDCVPARYRLTETEALEKQSQDAEPKQFSWKCRGTTFIMPGFGALI